MNFDVKFATMCFHLRNYANLDLYIIPSPWTLIHDEMLKFVLTNYWKIPLDLFHIFKSYVYEPEIHKPKLHIF